MPDFSPGWFRVDAWVIIVLAVLVVAFIVLAVTRGVAVHRRRAATGWEDLVGRTAEARTALDPRGTVFVQGEIWRTVSEDGRVEAGEEVTITRVENLVLYVTRKR